MHPFDWMSRWSEIGQSFIKLRHYLMRPQWDSSALIAVGRAAFRRSLWCWRPSRLQASRAKISACRNARHRPNRSRRIEPHRGGGINQSFCESPYLNSRRSAASHGAAQIRRDLAHSSCYILGAPRSSLYRRPGRPIAVATSTAQPCSRVRARAVNSKSDPAFFSLLRYSRGVSAPTKRS
jgi:hypothetical protein